MHDLTALMPITKTAPEIEHNTNTQKERKKKKTVAMITMKKMNEVLVHSCVSVKLGSVDLRMYTISTKSVLKK